MLTTRMIIKHELEKAGFSGAYIAQKFKVSRSYVCRIIAGNRGLRGRKAKGIKKFIAQKIKADPKRLWGAPLSRPLPEAGANNRKRQ